MGYNRHENKMKKYLYLFLLVASVLLVGCKSRNEPSQTSSGYIQVVNNTSDPYQINIKGNTSMSFSVKGKQSITKTVAPGYYNIRIKQQSGYYLYPTEKEYDCTVIAGHTYIVSF